MTRISSLDCTEENIELHELTSVNEIKVDESLLKYVYLYPIISYNILGVYKLILISLLQYI